MIREGSWEVPPVFTFLQEAGKLSTGEMKSTFNNGIGMILVVPETAAQSVLEFLAAMNEKAYVVGEIANRRRGGEQVSWA